MSSDLSRFHQLFFDEAKDHLGEMERLLLTLDVAAPNADDVAAIFRAAHSIKGGSGTFGFNDMTDVTHVLETLLDRVRKNELALTHTMVDVFLQAGDVLRAQLNGHCEGYEVHPDEAEPVLQRLRDLILTPSPSDTPQADSPPEMSAAQRFSPVYQIRYMPGQNPVVALDIVQAELARLGEVELLDGSDGDAVFCLHGNVTHQEIEDIFSFIAEPAQYSISGGATGPCLSAEDNDSFGFFEPLIAPACSMVSDEEDDGFGFFVDPVALRNAAVEEEQGYGFFAELPVAVAQNEVPKTTSLSGNATEIPRRRAADREADSSIRVGIDKVDQLINLVGELVITHAMLAQSISTLDPVLHEKLFNGMGQLERNSRDLQESVMSIRMLPIGSVFNRFPRLVRDISSKLGKQVELKLVGENTELDKGLIERLADPLTHLVRNSLDHGIEAPAVRTQRGKAAQGRLTLQAAHQGGNIVIEVIDDGAGLNRQKILAKAAERGIAVSENPSDQEVWQLIFAPGFSTADQVTDVSGRGVGMDVVRSNIEGMGGRVEIASEPDAGTRITIRLPLTLAILDGMSVGIGDQTFILPLNMIVESLQPLPEQIATIAGTGRTVHVRGEYLPLLALHEVFHITPISTDPCQGIVVILEVEAGKVALLVDALLGQHQVVIKSLENNYRKVRGVSGATIMGDGRVALILDAAALIQLGRN